MLEILLIRHGATDWNHSRRVMGRLPIPLNTEGRRQADRLRGVLRELELDAVYASPVRRAWETARRALRGRKVRIWKAWEVAEIEYGRWVGRYFDELVGERNYLLYHDTPSRSRAPGGESVREVYRRATGLIERIRRRHKRGRVAVVSHADVIKAILVKYLKLHLDDLLKIRIDNGSVSSLYFNGRHTRILGVNCHPRLGHLFARTDQLLPHPK